MITTLSGRLHHSMMARGGVELQKELVDPKRGATLQELS